jgi:hypothetical protein
MEKGTENNISNVTPHTTAFGTKDQQIPLTSFARSIHFICSYSQARRATNPSSEDVFHRLKASAKNKNKRNQDPKDRY